MGGRIGGKHVTRSGTQITLGGVGPDLSFSTFSSITFIIRTVIRGLGVGGSILGRIRAGIDRSAVVTAGASSLSVTSLTRSLSHPRGFINVRFFGPIPVVPLMRVVHKPGDDSRLSDFIRSSSSFFCHFWVWECSSFSNSERAMAVI